MRTCKTALSNKSILGEEEGNLIVCKPPAHMQVCGTTGTIHRSEEQKETESGATVWH